MQNRLLLFSLVASAFANPLATVPAVSRRQNICCPAINVTDIGLRGDGCEPGQWYANRDDRGLIGHANIDRYSIDSPKAGARKTYKKTCTAYINLAYPLPVPEGCKPVGSFQVRTFGQAQFGSGADALRKYTIDFPNNGQSDKNGPNTAFFQNSIPISQRQQTVKQYAADKVYKDEGRVIPFTFASAPAKGTKAGSKQVPLTTVKLDFEIAATTQNPFFFSLDAFDLLILTDGAPDLNQDRSCQK